MPLIFEDYYTAEELAALKNVNIRTVYEWLAKGIAPSWKKWGRVYLFFRKEAEAFTPPKRGIKKRAR